MPPNPGRRANAPPPPTLPCFPAARALRPAKKTVVRFRLKITVRPANDRLCGQLCQFQGQRKRGRWRLCILFCVPHGEGLMFGS